MLHHTLRHAASTWTIQRGVPLWAIAGVLGRSDIRMVEKHHAHHSPDHQPRSVAAISQALAKMLFAPRQHP